MARLLVIEDEKDLQKVLEFNLRQAGHDVLTALRGREGLQLAREHHPDLVLLDLMLPDLAGTEICKALKQDAHTRDIAVLMLTAKGEEVDRIVGFELGADDYVVKPFAAAEVIARIRAVLRRSRRPEPTDRLTVGDVTIDVGARRAWLEGRELSLTRKEFDLLTRLARSAGQVVTREDLMSDVWDENWFGSTKTLDVHMTALRRKLGEDSAAPRHIQTVRGVGFRFAPAQEG